MIHLDGFNTFCSSGKKISGNFILHYSIGREFEVNRSSGCKVYGTHGHGSLMLKLLEFDCSTIRIFLTNFKEEDAFKTNIFFYFLGSTRLSHVIEIRGGLTVEHFW